MRTRRRLSGESRLRLNFPRSPFAILLFFAILAAAAVFWRSSAHGQSQSPIPLPFPPAGQNTGRPQLGQQPDASQDPMVRHAQMEAAKRRSIERQNKLKADSDKIVDLAQQLSTSIQTEEKNPAQPEMAKKADEIEKLARSVRELMKSE